MRAAPLARRLKAGIARRVKGGPQPPAAPAPERLDSWLEALYGDRLAEIDRACAEGGDERFALFRGLPDDLWALLLTRQYDAYPNLRALLPDVPEPGLQELWNGRSGVALAQQGRSFYSRVRERYALHSERPLAESRVLDFGCGWGRLTRFFARDVQPGALYGCDPVDYILDVCRQSRVPATLARSELVPDRLPFDEPMDLVFSFSVFTHISERAHLACLAALHAGIAPGGVLVLTVRPPAYLDLSPLMEPVPGVGAEARYVFAPHPAEESHHQWQGGEMTYGEAVVTLPYVRERWSPQFELLEVDVLVDDLYQVMLTLRRR